MNAKPLGTLGVLLLAICSDVFAAESPESKADRMLAAIGGREAWAAIRSTVNDSQQNRRDEPTVVRAVITMDFTKPRFHIETTAPGLRLVRAVDGDRHWRLTRDGSIEPIPAETLASDLRWYAGHVYRTIHRVAARDEALTLVAGRDGRLEVHENDSRIAWFALDARGEPYAFGAHDDESGTLCGPWEFEKGGIRHPLWVSNPDGTWRAMIKALEVNVPVTNELLARPDAN